MREQEVRELYQAYLDVYSNSNKGVSEVEQLNEDFPKQVGDFLKRGGDELRKRLPGVANVLSPVRPGQRTVTADQQKAKIKPVGEAVENWVNSLIDEGYDLSEYTWDDMYEMYVNLDEGNRGENKTKMSNVSKLRRRQQNFAAGIVHPDEAGELEGERKKAHISKRYVPTRGSGVREGYDTFDAILEHLVAEGYADTNESALAIMANMSEEWRESIVEGGTGAFVPSRVDDFNNRRDMLKNRYGQDVSPRIPGPSGGGQGGTTPTTGVLKLARGTSSSKRGVESKNNA